MALAGDEVQEFVALVADDGGCEAGCGRGCRGCQEEEGVEEELAVDLERGP